MKAKCGLVFLVTVVFGGSPASSQTAVPLTPESVKSALSMPESEQRKALTERLDFRDMNSGLSCYDVAKASLKTLWMKGSNQLTVVETSSFDCEDTFVVVFAGGPGAWDYVGTIALWVKYTDPKYRAEALFNEGRPGIIVSNLTVDSGTGVSQQNMRIFAVEDGKLRVVFNEPEKMQLAIPYRPECCPVNYHDGQVSRFRVHPPLGDKGPAVIEEKRTITVNGHTVMELKSYVWNRNLRIFASFGKVPTLEPPMEGRDPPK